MTSGPTIRPAQDLSRTNNSSAHKDENVLLSVGINIVLPTLILKRLSTWSVTHWGDYGPVAILILALLIPLSYGLWDYWQCNRRSFLAVLGFMNTLFTGGLALMQSEGIWFAIKETSVPLVLGIAVLVAVRLNKPVIQQFLFKPQFMNLPAIESRLNERGSQQAFTHHMRLSSLFLAGPFFLSAVLNFVLARRIFAQIDTQLPASERTAIINQQIGDMTWISFLVIALPSMFFLIGILWFAIRGIQKHTGLKLEEIFK